MIPLYAYFFLLLGLPVQQTNGVCDCKPSVEQNTSESYRYGMKHEKDFSKYPEHAGTIRVETVRSWEKTYRKKERRVFEQSERMKETPEDSIYTLSGIIYSAKINEHDCDLHLEIGTEDINALRTVAEITKDNCNLQEQVMQQLKAKGFSMGQQNSTGVKCTLTGLGFYDGKHPLKKNKKYEKGSAWEIHPVISITLE